MYSSVRTHKLGTMLLRAGFMYCVVGFIMYCIVSTKCSLNLYDHIQKVQLPALPFLQLLKYDLKALVR